MDLVKIGRLLQELRKEKGLTQEQLAERMGVARRTVSRWETGSNMPDLDILMELADLYAVDLREILSGERKSERMDREMKETVLQVADYSNEEKTRLLRRMHGLFLAGLIGFAAFLVIALLGLENTAPYEAIGSFGMGLAFGVLLLGLIFTGRSAAKIKAFKLRLLGKAGKERS
ncbi:MAG: helix-turn-helix domain-containing protein [Oscillospiraceae bacterium]|nr:helix-turn-helix domain-containing protein [Oscillospiraceae bacterium]